MHACACMGEWVHIRPATYIEAGDVSKLAIVSIIIYLYVGHNVLKIRSGLVNTIIWVLGHQRYMKRTSKGDGLYSVVDIKCDGACLTGLATIPADFLHHYHRPSVVEIKSDCVNDVM